MSLGAGSLGVLDCCCERVGLSPVTEAAQRARLIQIHDNLVERIAEARTEGWLGEVDGLQFSLTATRDKLAQLDARTTSRTPIQIGMPQRQTPQTSTPAPHQTKII